MIRFYPNHEDERLGLIPEFLSEHDPRPAREQLDERYAHGGGWRPMAGWTLKGNTLQYPGDDKLHVIAVGRLRDEIIAVFPNAWVAIIQPDDSYEVARMD